MRLYFDSEMLIVLNTLLHEEEPIEIEDLLDRIDFKRRKFFNVLNKINTNLSTKNLEGIINKRGDGYYIADVEKSVITTLLNSKEDVEITFSSEQRQYFMICLILFPKEKLTVAYFENEYSISRNTVFNDFKVVKDIFSSYSIDLNYSNENGYFVLIDNFKRLSILQFYLYELLYELPVSSVRFIEDSIVNENRLKLIEINREMNGIYSPEEVEVISLTISIVYMKKLNFNVGIEEINNFNGTSERILVEKYFSNFDHQMQMYITIQLCGNHTPNNILEFNRSDIELFQIANNLVEDFERISCINTVNKFELINSIFIHLKVNSLLSKYSIQLISPLIKDIEKNYEDVYVFTKIVIKKYSEMLHFFVSDNLIAGLTLHFGSHISRNQTDVKQISVAIVCPTGASTSKLLSIEIADLLGTQVNIELSSIVNYKEIEERVDYFISTVHFESIKPVITVKPILTAKDKENILNGIFKRRQIIEENNFVDEILSIIKTNVSTSVFHNITQQIEERFSNTNKYRYLSSHTNLGLSEVLNISKIIICDREVDWVTAIKETSVPLMQKGSFTQSYVDQMISLVETYGPYIMLGDHIALAHSEPVPGRTFLDVSIMISKKGIKFNNKSIVKILFVLSSPNNEAHTKILRQISNITRNGDLTKIIDSKTNLEALSEILKLI